MADERIDIEVTDKVAKSIKTELLAIAQAAREGHGTVSQVRKELAALSLAANASSRTLTAQAKAQAAMAVADSRAAEAKAKVALAEQRVATEAAKTAQATARAEKASQERERQAKATATAIDREAAAAARLSRIPITGGGVLPSVSGSHPFGQYGEGTKSQAKNQTFAMDPANDPTPQIKKAGEEAEKTSDKLNKMGESGKLATHHMTNLGFQLNDIFVSLASGQKPLTVFIQQGAQIGQIAAQSGVGMGEMAKQAGLMVLRFWPLAAAAGAVYAAFALMERGAEQQSGSLKEYVKTLGLTQRELKRLKDVTVTSSDVMKAVWQVALERITGLFGFSTKDITKTWSNFLDFLWSAAKKTAAGVYATFSGMFYAASEIAKRAAKGDFSPIEGTIEGYKKAYEDGLKFIEDVETKAGKNAQERLKKQADEMIKLRTPKKPKVDHTEENRALAMMKVNLQLDNELERMKMLRPEREAAQRFDQIEEQLAGRKIKLSKDEAAAIKDKIKAIQGYSYVQSAMDQIYDSTIAKEKEYYATLLALNQAVKDGTISETEAARRRNIAIEQYKDIQDPLRQYNKQLQDQKDLLGLYGNAATDAARAQQLFNEAVANGTANTDTGSYKDFMPQASQERKDQSVHDTIEGYISDEGNRQDTIDNYQAVIDKLKELDEEGVISHRQAVIAKQKADEEYVHARLSGAESMFDALAGLQNSSSKELAAIGKAAAIAQATIDGYLAVQKALAASPPPFNYIAAAAVGATTALNVAKIAGIGFEQGGYTGNGGTKDVAGVVHGQEYVFDARSTSRIGVPTLEAIRSGRLTGAPTVGNNPSPVRVIQHAGVEITETVGSDGITELDVRRMIRAEAPKVVAQDMKASPNSHMSKAMQSSYQVKRNR